MGKTTTKKIAVKTSIRAGGLTGVNHGQSVLKVKTRVRAGSRSLTTNHSQSALKLKTRVRAGGWTNHSESLR